MKYAFEVNEAIHLSHNGVLIPSEDSRDIMADILLNQMQAKPISDGEVSQAGIFLQDGCKNLIPVVNGRPLFQLEQDFSKAIRVLGYRVAQTPTLFVEGTQDAFTLGLLAEYGFVYARVKEHNLPWLQSTYEDLTGEPLPPVSKGNYLSVSDSNIEGSGDYFHVGFPALPEEQRGLLSFGFYKVGTKRMSAPIRWEDWDACAKYNSKNYILSILKMGFRLGKNLENVSQIRQNVKDVDAFDRGSLFFEKAA
jgi:hypothetical protein